MQALGSLSDLLKSEWVGSNDGEKADDDSGSSSPSRHWPQKDVTAHAAIAASKGVSRSRFWTSCTSIVAFIGGRGGFFDEFGAKLWTPLRM